MALTGTVGLPVLPWPLGLSRQPDPEHAPTVAGLWTDVAIELECSQRGDPLLTLAAIARATVRFEPLYAGEGGERALLLPQPRGGFVVVIDPELTPQETGAPVPDVHRLRLAHELAHLAFFAAGAPPWRLRPWAPREEIWCDLVATELVTAVNQRSEASAA